VLPEQTHALGQNTNTRPIRLRSETPPNKGGRRANDAIVGVVRTLYTMTGWTVKTTHGAFSWPADKKETPPVRGTSAQRCYRWGSMLTVHHDWLNRQNDAHGILLVEGQKRRPHKGGRRPNDAIVGGVLIIYTMFYTMSRINFQFSVNFLRKGLLNDQRQA